MKNLLTRLVLIALPLSLYSLPALAQTHTFTLTWEDHATNEEGFEIERCSNSGCSNFEKLFTTVGANVLQVADTVPNPDAGGLTYRYRVRAFNAQGFSDYTNIADGVTPVNPMPPNGSPSNLEISAVTASEIHFSWRDNADNESAQLFRWQQWQPPRDGEIVLAANITRLTLSGLKKNTPYCGTVAAVLNGAESAPSNEACAVTLRR